MPTLLNLLPTAPRPYADRIPEDLAEGTPAPLAAQLRQVLGEDQVRTSVTDLVAYASDASPYRMIPQVVLQPRTTGDVARILQFARDNGRHVVFRTAGTSLNGQAQGDDILVDVRRHFAWAQPEDDGRILNVGCGMVVARANAALGRYGRKIGPDPASSAAACIGGVIANNASGMQAGTRWNSYETITSMTVVLPSGTVVDTAAPDADARLTREEPQLVEGLLALRDEIRGDAALSERIRQKFSMKNTNGYRLDAFLDEDSPAQILRRVVVGSQGTLGFVADARFRTLEVGRHHVTAFVCFPDLFSAADVIPRLMEAGARTAELMDEPSLRGTARISGAPSWQHHITPGQAGVLTDFRSDDPAAVDAFEQQLREIISPTQVAAEITRDPKTAGGFWAVRSGLLPAVGGDRPKGTAVLTEDVCVPPARIAEAARDLGALLDRNGFPSSVQGHASAGNLHFILLLDPTDPEHLERYLRVMDEVVELIVGRFDGALKGEHGTGRNMAPYLEREWGPQMVALMRRIKDLFDPHGILAPGVLLNDDPQANIRHLKAFPEVGARLDPCIECGFCEPVCPSRDVTTTPRQRIALQREAARQGGATSAFARLAEQYEYSAVETCAGDSTCAMACPVDIDTGEAMKELRHAQHSPAAEAAMLQVARWWRPATAAARLLVGAAGVVHNRLGEAPLRAASAVGRRLLGEDRVPSWIGTLPRAAGRLPDTAATPRATDITTTQPSGIVYFPACINRIFGAPQDAPDNLTVIDAIIRLGERAEIPVMIPRDVQGLCCGTVWHSKGFVRGHEEMANRLVETLWEASEDGQRTVVIDASSCTLGALREVPEHLSPTNRARHAQLRIIDALTWAREDVLPRLDADAVRKVPRAVVHETCSMRHLDLGEDLRAVTAALADEVIDPGSSCCGFAGDRGFLHPELTAGATRVEAEAVSLCGGDTHLSGNRTCELGMEHATGEPYEPVLVALERATR